MGDLLRRLKAAGVPLYALTNNTREIVVYHRQNTDLIGLFDDVMVSADIGLRKPDPAIYQHMLDKHRLKAQDTVFIDDMPENVKAAQDMGIDAFVFTSPGQCRHELTKRGFASAA
jgi:putative hydrolase of the HAD superfamily